MDFSIFYQLRTKKIWWVDVVFYFVISLLVSAVFCYLIFIFKIYLQEKNIKNLDAAIETVGTDVQKDQEKTVFGYQKKLNDYALMLTNHEFASNVFVFIEKETLPNVWFSKFGMPTKQNQIDLSGEADNLDALSRQTSAFEKNEFIKKVSLLGSSIGDSGKVNFNLSLLLDKKIFDYVPPPLPKIPAVITNPAENGQQPAEIKSAEKQILSFDFSLNPEIVGSIDQTNHTVVLNVQNGADITNLAPSINVSPKSVAQPASNVAQNFTNPVAYTITAEDGSSQNYTVTVNVGVAANAESGKPKNVIAFFIAGIIAVIIIVLGIFIFLKKRSKKNQVDMSKINNI